MAPCRPLTDKEKEEKNRKLRERRAMEDASTKVDRLKEQREREKVTNSENKKRRLDPQGREQRSEQAISRHQGETNVEREERLRKQAARRNALGQEGTLGQDGTIGDTMARAVAVRSRHQQNLAEDAQVRRRKDAIIMHNLRDDREENKELLQAMNAQEHAEMIPIETAEERSYRERALAERNRVGVPRTHRAACKAIIFENRFPVHYCGEMDMTCQNCCAKHFKAERPPDKKFSQCCRKGRVLLPPPKECPQPLLGLLQGTHPEAKSFLPKIRNYNQDSDSWRAEPSFGLRSRLYEVSSGCRSNSPESDSPL